MEIINRWLHTGDIVRKDEEGYYYHVGRKDFIFKSGGEKIVPNVIERVLREIGGSARRNVFGSKDASLGNRICAVVVKVKRSNLTNLRRSIDMPDPTGSRMGSSRSDFCRGDTRSLSGKIRFDELQKQIPCSKGKKMEERLRELILNNFPTISHRLRECSIILRENGFTSLMFVGLILLLEKEFSIEVLDEESVRDASVRLSGLRTMFSVNLMGGPFRLCLFAKNASRTNDKEIFIGFEK